MVTETLVKNVMETRYEDLPAETIAEAKRSLLNWAGVAIGAAYHPSMEKVLAVSKTLGTSRQASVLGRPEKVDLLFASLLNGMSSHIFDFDDTLLETVLHPSAPVYPAILAYAEHYGKTGKEVLEAFVIGCEVEARIAKCLYPSHYWRGWHITGTAGTLGAAAAVAKLQGLDKERFSYALGIAATEPTGLREMFGTMTKPYHPGKAAMNGLMAALLAEQGFTSSVNSLEAERGYGHVLSDEPKFREINDGWGETWEIVKNSYKPFASGIVTHPSIDGVIQIKEEHSLTTDQIEKIELQVHPLVKELTGKENPQTGLEGKFSVFHCAAVGFLDGKAGVKQFTDERVLDSDVVSLRDKVKIKVDDQIEEDQVKLIVTLTSGDTLRKFIEHALGSMDVPLSDKQLEDKFFDVTADVIDNSRQTNIIETVKTFENLKNVNAFLEACRTRT